MFITADQLLCHGIGDYLLQSDWMANTKTQRASAALAHVLTYSIPFFFLTTSWKALLVIAGTHFVIDHWRLARYVVWAKNFLAPKWVEVTHEAVVPSSNVKFTPKDGFKPVIEPSELKVSTKEFIRNHPWKECSATGYHKDRPPFLSVWLLIFADNIMHVLINGAALKWLG